MQDQYCIFVDVEYVCGVTVVVASEFKIGGRRFTRRIPEKPRKRERRRYLITFPFLGRVREEKSYRRASVCLFYSTRTAGWGWW